MTDTSHLTAIHQRLCNERRRLAEAKTDKERQQRSVWVAQAEKELDDEMKFLGMSNEATFEGSDDDLAKELGL